VQAPAERAFAKQPCGSSPPRQSQRYGTLGPHRALPCHFGDRAARVPMCSPARSRSTCPVFFSGSHVLHGIPVGLRSSPVGHESPRFSAGSAFAKHAAMPHVPSFFSGYRRHGPPVLLSSFPPIRPLPAVEGFSPVGSNTRLRRCLVLFIFLFLFLGVFLLRVTSWPSCFIFLPPPQPRPSTFDF